MSEKINIAGIYDLRTLRLLKSKGIKSFGFEFSPTSFNFLQAHIFLNDLLPLIQTSDEIILHFSHSSDLMIEKLLLDIKKQSNISGSQIILACDKWSEPPSEKGVRYLLNYGQYCEWNSSLDTEFAGVVLDFDFLNKLHIDGVLLSFIQNFYSTNKTFLDGEKLLILRAEWSSNIFPSLFDSMDFDRVSLPLDSKVEVCYRNMDLKKLSFEIDLFQYNYQI